MEITGAERSSKSLEEPSHKSFLTTVLGSNMEGASLSEDIDRLKEIVDNEMLQFYVRRIAGGMLFKLEGLESNVKNKSCLLAGILEDHCESLLHAWIQHVQIYGYPAENNGFHFFSELLKTYARMASVSVSAYTRIALLYSVAFYYHVRKNKEAEKNITFFMKSFVRTDHDAHEVWEECMTRMDRGVECKYLFLAALINKFPHMVTADCGPLLAELEYLAGCQHGSAVAYPVFASLVRSAPSAYWYSWLLGLSSSPRSSLRTNIHRVWLARLSANEENVLLQLLRDSWMESAADPPLFPPSPRDCHELSCIDPFFGFEEAEDVIWPSEASLLSSLSLLCLLSRRKSSEFKWEEWRRLLLRGAIALLPEARLASLRLINNSKLNVEWQESRLLFWANIYGEEEEFEREMKRLVEGKEKEWMDAMNEEERKEVEILAHKGKTIPLLLIGTTREVDLEAFLRHSLWNTDSAVQKKAYRQLGGSIVDEEKERMWIEIRRTKDIGERERIFLRWLIENGEEKRMGELAEERLQQGDWTAWAELRLQLGGGSAADAEERRLQLLSLSGSSSASSCPSFTQLAATLAEAGTTGKVFCKDLKAQLSLIAVSSPSRAAALSLLDTLLRCRFKSVVDHSCILLDDLLRVNAESAHIIFQQALSALLGKGEFRSSAVSRPLLLACIHMPSLTLQLESSLLPFISHPNQLTPRILKTLKLFISSLSLSKMSDSFVECVFFSCLLVQSSTSFLVRSSAICLFGFCCQSLVSVPPSPLFCLLSLRPSFSARLFSLLLSLHRYPRIVAVLVLSFISRFSLVSAFFYGDKELSEIDAVRQSISSLLLLTWRKRERRFIVDALLSLSTPMEKKELMAQLSHHNGHCLSDDALQYLLSTQEGESEERTILCRSEYVKRVETAVEEGSVRELEGMEVEGEQGAQAAAIGMSEVIRRRREGMGEEERKRVMAVAETLLCHERLRVRALTVRAVSPLLPSPSLCPPAGDSLILSQMLRQLREWVLSE